MNKSLKTSLHFAVGLLLDNYLVLQILELWERGRMTSWSVQVVGLAVTFVGSLAYWITDRMMDWKLPNALALYYGAAVGLPFVGMLMTMNEAVDRMHH